MDPASTVNEFIRRVVALDLTSAGELVADDIEYDNVPVGKNFGRDAMIGFLSGMNGQFDEVEFVVHRQTADGNTVMNERSDRFRIGDAWIDLPVAGVFEVGDDGRITLWRDYFDMRTFRDQQSAVTAADRPSPRTGSTDVEQ
ncbi:MAG: limonene-1,2-epoxide hydrolase family protein [Ilumatobacteraceae bacterium]